MRGNNQKNSNIMIKTCIFMSLIIFLLCFIVILCIAFSSDDIYEKLGFIKMEEEKEQDGLKFTPMKLILKFNNI